MSISENPPRRKKGPGTAAKPFSIRLTDAERQQLAQCAGPTPLATFVRDLVLSRLSQAQRSRTRAVTTDAKAIARLLSMLGQSGIAVNLTQLAKAADIGVLELTPEAHSALTEACKSVIAMRAALLQALGVEEGHA